MASAPEVFCYPTHKRGQSFLIGLGVAAVGLTGVRAVYYGPDLWLGAGLLFGGMGIVALHGLTARVSADAYGVHSRTFLRRRSVPWRDIADVRVRVQRGEPGDIRRVNLVLRGGRERRLPLPLTDSFNDPGFDAKVEELRALHRRYGTPESDHLRVVSDRTAGRGWVPALAMCVLLLACAGVAVWVIPSAASDEQAWKSAVPCTARTPATERGECLTTLPAVIARTEVNPEGQRSWLYFTDDRPWERLQVSREAAQEFKPGQSVELTVWRREVTEIAGDGHIWREDSSGSGDLAVGAVLSVLLAGYPGARLLQRLRGRKLPDDDVLPSVVPFMGALCVTAVWLLPLSYLHPTTLLDSPLTVTWTAAGSAVTLGLFIRAWRTTRVDVPGPAGAPGGEKNENDDKDEDDEEVFLSARFLDSTDYNPYCVGTHIVLGGEPPAVTPHPGPGRFAAKRIPVERLTVKEVRRARGGDGEAVPSNWHVAELDDAGTPVRLAAAPKDLTRIIRELSAAKPANTGDAAH